MKISRIICAALTLSVAGLAHAEIKQAAADGFFLAYSAPLETTTAAAYADLVQVQKWWNGEHTFSGKAANLSLKPEAGGCFCERWTGGSVEHGRVIMALPGKLLRLDTALGPLQEFALKGVLSFWLREDDYGKARIELEYRVNGASASGLDQFAPHLVRQPLLGGVLPVLVGVRLRLGSVAGDGNVGGRNGQNHVVDVPVW